MAKMIAELESMNQIFTSLERDLRRLCSNPTLHTASLVWNSDFGTFCDKYHLSPQSHVVKYLFFFVHYNLFKKTKYINKFSGGAWKPHNKALSKFGANDLQYMI